MFLFPQLSRICGPTLPILRDSFSKTLNPKPGTNWHEHGLFRCFSTGRFAARCAEIAWKAKAVELRLSLDGLKGLGLKGLKGLSFRMSC